MKNKIEILDYLPKPVVQQKAAKKKRKKRV
jgi:hypothetical protein